LAHLNTGHFNLRHAGLDIGCKRSSLLKAGNFKRNTTERHVRQMRAADAITFDMGWIGALQLQMRARTLARLIMVFILRNSARQSVKQFQRGNIG
jgi:hypothetical protein